MSYNKRIQWKDHVRDSKAYSMTKNGDDTVNLTPAGNVLQQGTPQSATNFNTMEEALQHMCNAYDFMVGIYQAELRNALDKVEALEKKVATLSS